VTAGATIYILRDTRITFQNTGTEVMTIAAIFSKPGSEEMLRDASVLEGQPVTPLSDSERAAILEKGKWHTVYEGSVPGPPKKNQ
jgi:hypothetical protein